MKTSFRVMKTDEFPDSVFYRVACDCGSEDCDLTMEFEYNKEVNMIFLNLYKRIENSAYGESSWSYFDFIRVLKNKLKLIFQITFKGYIETQACLVLRDKKHIEEFINAIKEGLEFVNERSICEKVETINKKIYG